MQSCEPIRPEPPLLLLLDTKDLASMLGRSRSSIERDDRQGRIPSAIKLGRHKRWRTREIAAWIEAGCPPRADWKFKSSAGNRPEKPKAPGA